MAVSAHDATSNPATSYTTPLGRNLALTGLTSGVPGRAAGC